MVRSLVWIFQNVVVDFSKVSYWNLYEDNLSIAVVNNIPGKYIKNVRQSIRQGDKFAMELFSFGMDPILGYLERRLQGIPVHSIPVQGPVLLPRPPLPLDQPLLQPSLASQLSRLLHLPTYHLAELTTNRCSQVLRPGTYYMLIVTTWNRRLVTYGNFY